MADPEKPKTIVESIRRFTDARISSILHSLIGLPSMLQPPPNCGEDGEVSGRAQAATTTNKAPPAPSPPRGEEGEGNKRVVGDYCNAFGNPLFLRFEGDPIGECLKSLTLIPFPHIPEEVFLTRDKDMDSRLREVLGKAVEEEKGRGMGRLGSACALSPSSTPTPSSKIISSLASNHSFTGPDGVTRTTHVFKPRFADD